MFLDSMLYENEIGTLNFGINLGIMKMIYKIVQ